MCGRIAAVFGRRQARRARAQGLYNRSTRRRFARVWQQSGRTEDLVAYALFRRDQGLRLPRRWIVALQQALPRLKQPQQWQARLLLLEREALCPGLAPKLVTSLMQPVLLRAYRGHRDYSELTPAQHALADIDQLQAKWRLALAERLHRAAAGSGICVVGNAGYLQGLSLGTRIDQHDCVLRFNQFARSPLAWPDVGQQCQLWCVTAGVPVESLTGLWGVALSGPEVQYRLLDWSAVVSLRMQGAPLLTLPLAVWRQLVRYLQAPPSAGISWLAFLHSVLHSWEGVRVVGFGGLATRSAPYHHTDARKLASPRHNWAGEQQLLQQWLAQGLHSLHD